MNARSRLVRRCRRASSFIALVAAGTVSIAIAACGSGSAGVSSASSASGSAFSFARCMRSHGVSNFPDSLDVRDVPGVNPSSRAFEAAQTACQNLLPVKAAPSAAPSARTRARLVRLANCLRMHGYPTLPDPHPDPPPAPGSAEASAYHTLYGEGDYWIGIPKTIDAHGAAFVHAAIGCGATGVG